MPPSVWAAAACVAAALTASPAAQACGYHDAVSASVGMLNWAYPDSLHVRTAVWMAQREGILARADAGSDADPGPASSRFQQMLRYRDTQFRLETLRGALGRVGKDQAAPQFSIVLIGSMLWTRFERAGGELQMHVHATGPAPDDVVIVTDEPVLTAFVEGQLAPREARERGLVKFYGETGTVEQVSTLFDRLPPSIHRDAGHKSIP
jgi:hypothetical protein